MTKIRATIVFAVSILSVLLAFTANAQDTLTTMSGQVVILHKNGDHSVLPPGVQTSEIVKPSDEGSTDGSVFEIPTQKSIAMTSAQKALHSQLTSKLQQSEVSLMLEERTKKTKLQEAQQRKGDGAEKYVNALKGDVKNTTKSYRNVSRKLMQLQKLKLSPDDKLDKKLNKIKEYTELNLGALPVNTPTAISVDTVAAVAEPTLIAVEGYATTFQPVKKGRDLINNCTIVYEGKDKVTGKNKKEVAAANFFNFTQPKLKPYFKAEDFLTADAFLTKIGKDYFLTLKIKLRSKDASKSYGSIDLNSELRLQYIDGDQSLLYSIVQDYGEIEAYSGHTIYTAVYPLNNDAISYMSKKFLDSAGIMWSSGFEQYDIYQVDFLKEQMNCLKNGTYSKK